MECSLKLGVSSVCCGGCDNCADGVHLIQPIGVELLCEQSKTYLDVDENTNFAFNSPERSSGAASCETFEQGTNKWTPAGRTKYQKYGIVFDVDGNAFINADDQTWGLSEDITLDDGTIVNNVMRPGNAGDCFGNNDCDMNKRGSFSVDLSGTAVAFDSQLEWESTGWTSIFTIVGKVDFRFL